ncbi:hypothetical protein DD237_000762 [Peronospora effusa]|uniref:Uncharacterized protein n=1 Tax=Peronospora effusa TaxID=542832 RepID=A0A425CJV7_9STRA|nr:hypothetical protein DD237_000762 [Peronospora effusa]
MQHFHVSFNIIVLASLQREAVEAPFRRFGVELDTQLLPQSNGDFGNLKRATRNMLRRIDVFTIGTMCYECFFGSLSK